MKIDIPLTLASFIETFVEHNTVVRIWVRDGNGRKLIPTEDGRQTCMEWEILNGTYHRPYADCYVLGVTDILCEHDREAVNIVIRAA